MMEIYLVKARQLLHVLSAGAEFAGKPVEGAPFRRRFGGSQGVAFIFEKTMKGLFLYVSFDRYKDPGVLCRITNGQSVGELQVLWKLAHLPRAKIFGSKVMLPDGRSVELIDTVGFELRKVWEGVWESEKNETEANRRLRQMRLNRLGDEVPGMFSERPLGAVAEAGNELLFSDKDAMPGGPLETKKQPTHMPQKAEPETDFKKPTAESVNSAIELLLWRCRDAEIHKNTPNGKGGFYRLGDWISKANDDMIRELGLWCADIQELNIGHRDS